MPTPTSPILEGLEQNEVIYAKNQPEYTPLPVLRRSDGMVLSRWTLTDAEREAIASGADIFLYCWTANKPLQPVAIEIGECDRDRAAMVERLGMALPVAGKIANCEK